MGAQAIVSSLSFSSKYTTHGVDIKGSAWMFQAALQEAQDSRDMCCPMHAAAEHALSQIKATKVACPGLGTVPKQFTKAHGPRGHPLEISGWRSECSRD